ncbi:hypothetical protein [Methanosarcina mazei]|nr:hypothetical protein [Methanosarcina mazei]
MNIKGDAAIGDNAKIVKTESKKSSLFDILVGIATIVGVLIVIYQFLKN